MTSDSAEQSDFEALPWVSALRDGLAESDRRIENAPLNDGWAIVHHRGRVIREAMKCFYEHVVHEVAPRGAYAIHALGGTGRQEICPGSDVDIGIVVENIEENEHFFKHVSQQLRRFAPLAPGLRDVVKANAFEDLRDERHFDLTSLASLLDADLLVGGAAFNDRIRRACQQRAAELGLDFIFSINQDLRRFDQRYSQPPGDVGEFHVKNGIGGLRNFQMTMWLYAFERWIPSVQVYEQVRNTRRFDSEGAPTPRVLEAVSVIFSVRCWIEQRHRAQSANVGKKRFDSLLIEIADMADFLKRFGAEGLTELNAARETISSYRHETLDRLLEYGVVVPETDGLVVWGRNGLRIGADSVFRDATEMFFTLYGARQRFQLPIDKSVKRAAQKNIAKSLRPDRAFMQLMAGAGEILPALRDWSEYGILDKLLPRFGELASRLYAPEHRAAALTQAARAMQRVRNLEHLSAQKPASPQSQESQESYFVRLYEEIGESALCAVRLALLTEEIPQSPGQSVSLYPECVSRYIDECLAHVPGLSDPTLQTIKFLMLMKREFIKSPGEQILENWQQRIRALQSRDPADTIRALALFIYAAFDFNRPEGVDRDRLDFEQWQNVKNLTQNLLHDELNVWGQPFEHHFFDEVGQRIGSLLPRRLLASPHVDNSLKPTYDGAEILDPQRAHRIIHALQEVCQTGHPRVSISRNEKSCRLSLFAWDFTGLFWRVAGALLDAGCSIRTTDLYDIPDPGDSKMDGERHTAEERRLIFDVLTFDAPKDDNKSWEDDLKSRILQRLENHDELIPDNTGEILAPVIEELTPRLTDLDNGLVKFSCQSPADNKGMRYAISRLLAELAGANIESIARDGTRDWPIPRTNFYIRIESDVATVATALQDRLGDIPIDMEPSFTHSSP